MVCGWLLFDVDGRVIITYPNRDRVQSRCWGEFWVEVDGLVWITVFKSSETDQGEHKTDQTNNKVDNSTHGLPPFYQGRFFFPLREWL